MKTENAVGNSVKSLVERLVEAEDILDELCSGFWLSTIDANDDGGNLRDRIVRFCCLDNAQEQERSEERAESPDSVGCDGSEK